MSSPWQTFVFEMDVPVEGKMWKAVPYMDHGQRLFYLGSLDAIISDWLTDIMYCCHAWPALSGDGNIIFRCDGLFFREVVNRKSGGWHAAALEPELEP